MKGSRGSIATSLPTGAERREPLASGVRPVRVRIAAGVMQARQAALPNDHVAGNGSFFRDLAPVRQFNPMLSIEI